MEAARARLIERLRREIADERVLEAMGRISRDLFIPPASRHLAYEDIPLPIGEGQTISQPYIVALMTQALELRGEEKVLSVTDTGMSGAPAITQKGRAGLRSDYLDVWYDNYRASEV